MIDDAARAQHARRLGQRAATVDGVVEGGGHDHGVEAAGGAAAAPAGRRATRATRRSSSDPSPVSPRVDVERRHAERAGQAPRQPAVSGADVEHPPMPGTRRRPGRMIR